MEGAIAEGFRYVQKVNLKEDTNAIIYPLKCFDSNFYLFIYKIMIIYNLIK